MAGKFDKTTLSMLGREGINDIQKTLIGEGSYFHNVVVCPKNLDLIQSKEFQDIRICRGNFFNDNSFSPCEDCPILWYKLRISEPIILEVCEDYCPTCEKRETCCGGLEYGAHTSCCRYHHIICDYFSDEINECVWPDSHDNFDCPYTGYSNYGQEHCTNCKNYREFYLGPSSLENACIENHFSLVKSTDDYCLYWKYDKDNEREKSVVVGEKLNADSREPLGKKVFEKAHGLSPSSPTTLDSHKEMKASFDSFISFKTIKILENLNNSKGIFKPEIYTAIAEILESIR